MSSGNAGTEHAGTEGQAASLAASVIRVLGPDGRTAGAGFLVGERLAATCAHVLTVAGEAAPPETVTVEFSAAPQADGAVAMTATVDPALWRAQDEGDVAFIRLAEPAPPHARPLPLGIAGGATGRRVKAFGFPLNAPLEGHYGYAVAGDMIGSGPDRRLQLTECSEVTEGFSGGPLADEGTGLVVGMISMIAPPDRYLRGAKTAYAIPVEAIRAVCPELAVSATSPYVGLRPFAAAEAPLFHGRDRAVQAVLASLRAEPAFLALFGPSGSGKTSLVQAGVLPALARGELPGSDRWDVITVTPGTEPFAQLVEAGLADASAGLALALKSRLASGAGRARRDRLVLVFDQFEEVLVQTEAASRDALFGQLADLAKDTAATVIIVMRDDFYSALAAAAPALMPAVGRGLVNVPATLDLSELTSIIAEPAASAGVAIEPKLAERIAVDTTQVTPSRGSAGTAAPVTVLPLLSSALAELWDRQQHGVLTHRMYEKMGGVLGWLDRWCDLSHDAARKRLPNSRRSLTRQVLTALVRPGDASAGFPPTRQRRTLEQIRGVDRDPDGTGVADAVSALADERLITTARDQASGAAVAELAHESLIHEWRQLGRWLTEDKDFLSWRRDAEAEQTQWERAARDSELLLHGSALVTARGWLASRPMELSAALTKFITDSDRAEQDRLTRDRRRATRFRLLAMVAAVCAVAAAVFGGVASDQSVRASQQATLARQQATLARTQAALARQQAQSAQAAKLASEAIELDGSQPDLAALLAVQGAATDPGQASWTSLEDVLNRPTELSRVLYGDTIFESVAYSPDASLVAAGDEAGQVWIWNAAAGRPVGIPFPQATLSIGGVEALAFSRDGKEIATLGPSLEVWNPSTHSLVRQLVRTTNLLVGGVAFSPDGKLLAATIGSGIQLWSTSTWQPVGHVMTEPQGDGNINGLAFSPDGASIAFGTDVGYVGIWNVATQTPRVTMTVANQADKLAFSPDGSQLAVPSYGGPIYLFSTATGKLTRQLPGSTTPANAAAYSPDGKMLAVGDSQGSITLWNPATGEQDMGLPGHTGRVESLAFSRDGQLASAADDGTVRLWSFKDIEPLGATLTGHSNTVNDVAFSPDGSQVATAGSDQTIRIWSAATGKQERVIAPFGVQQGTPPLGSPAPVDGVAWSPDGKLLASTGAVVSLWNPGSGTLVANLLTPGTQGKAQSSVAFSPDGKLLATAGDDGVRLFTVATGQPDRGALPGTIPGTGDPAGPIAFSPDGKLLAVAFNGISLWDVATRTRLAALPGPASSATEGGPYVTVAFSPDGKTLAAANPSGGVQLWDVPDRKLLGAPFDASDGFTVDPSNGVAALAFSPDGRLLALGDSNGSVSFWNVATRQRFAVQDTLDTAGITAVAFNRAGTVLATSSADALVRLWLTPAYWQAAACEIAGRNLTEAEWKQYVAVGSYVRDCPKDPSGYGATASAPAVRLPFIP